MGLEMDDEILQDFLIEASEILEQLGEQLVDLEQQPDNADLLNAIFRGFHTVKGGAGFLSITNLVEVCHRSEDVFNVLRQGQRVVDADLMDAVLQSLDVVKDMMAQVGEGTAPGPADAHLLERLTNLAQPKADDSPAPAPAAAPTVAPAPQSADAKVALDPEPVKQPESTPGEPASVGSGKVTEAEFESLLEELQGVGQDAGAAQPSVEDGAAVSDAKPADDQITEEEFESLLDELHGPGQFSVAPAADMGESAAPASADANTAQADVSAKDQDEASAGASSKDAAGDEITEEEFEALLDSLHGEGKHSGVPTPAAPAESPPAAAEDRPIAAPQAEKPAPKPVASVPQQAPAAAPAKAPQADTTLRVDTQRLDDIMNMVGELVLVRNRLSTLKSAVADEQLANAVGNLDVVTADLQLAVMKTRMQPVKKVFGRFPRVVRDLARNLNKEVDLVMHGEDTDLDKNLVEALADPMVHLVRNAVDHGIEPPQDRVAAGKPSKGRVVLSAAQEGDHILLSIQDDGRGMDPDVLRRKAVEKGLMDQEAAARLDPKDCFNLILHPGFSTKTEISDVSGRGVGMDVVKTKIAQMNGSVEINSDIGKGTKITIKLPLTLAILPTLMVVIGRQPFALPLASVVEIFNLDLSRTNTVDGQQTIRVRDCALPLFYLSRWLVQDAFEGADYSSGGGHVVVVSVGGMQIGLVVDYLVGQEEVVIKPLGALLQGLDGMAGATITGDGKIALILDVPGLMRKYASRY